MAYTLQTFVVIDKKHSGHTVRGGKEEKNSQAEDVAQIKCWIAFYIKNVAFFGLVFFFQYIYSVFTLPSEAEEGREQIRYYPPGLLLETRKKRRHVA